MALIIPMVLYGYGVICGFWLGYLVHGFIETNREIERYEKGLQHWSSPYDQ